MKKFILPVICILFTFSLSGCGLMEDAFKAGFIIAIIIAALIGLLIWIFHMSWKLLAKYFPSVRMFFGAVDDTEAMQPGE
jgi:hypothetical protein